MQDLQDNTTKEGSPYGASAPSHTPPMEAAKLAGLDTPLSLHFTNRGIVMQLQLRDYVSVLTASALAHTIRLVTDAPLVEIRRGNLLVDTIYRRY